MDTTADNELTGRVIGCAIEVHHLLGPELLESIYEAALSHELALNRIPFVRQHRLKATYKGADIGCDYVLDMVVDRRLVLEIKAVTQLLPIHEAQLLTYLKVSGFPLGLILNFNEHRLKDGIRRRRL